MIEIESYRNIHAAKQLQISLNLQLTHTYNLTYYLKWLDSLSDSLPHTNKKKITSEHANNNNESAFVNFFTHTLQRFLILGKIPTFELPEVVSAVHKDDVSEFIELTLALDFVRFVPLEAYKICIDNALKLTRWMAQNPVTQANKSYLFNLVDKEVIQPLISLVMSSKTTIPILSVAHTLQIPFSHLGLGVYQLGWGSRAKKLERSLCDGDSAIGVKLSQNKSYTANLIAMAGLPAPEHKAVSTYKEAENAAKHFGYPVVVKPIDLDRGEGITVDIISDDGLKRAFNSALVLTKLKQVLVERQVAGVCHRLFISHGKLLYAVKRLPMSVQGDGEHTVNELIDAQLHLQNQRPPWARSEIQAIDELAIAVMERVGILPESIPQLGVWVPLRRIESTQSGGIDEDVTLLVHPENIRIATEATRLMGLEIAGVDIISEDVTKPWFDNGAVINEVNSAPSLGEGQISRSYLPQFFAEIIEGNGRIPIEEADTQEQAKILQNKYQQQGLRCFITSPTQTFDFSGDIIPMLFDTIRKRLRALINRPDVDAIIVFY